ncbi:MAG: transcriptional repressor [bacterium]|nr:transcriptional repressor [bacterium]
MTIQRKTIVLEKVLEILQHTQNAISVSQLMDKLETIGIRPNKTTLYRLLEKLVSTTDALSITLKNGISYYELRQKRPHHHHFYCTKCDTVFCLGSCHVHTQKIDLTQLLPSPKFTVEAHDFNLYGVCESCR